MRNLEYHVVKSYLKYWEQKEQQKKTEKYTYWDEYAQDMLAINPPRCLRVWARLKCKPSQEENAGDYVQQLKKAIENDEAQVDVLVSYNDTTHSINIPQEFVKKYVSIEGFNTDVVEYDRIRDEITCDSFDVYLHRNEVA
ncbi:MAG: hypothetical protein ABIK73_06020 [candidate division WOR-3 bacterium]